MKSLFNKKFVYFMWDDELKDKKCFVADDMEDLETEFIKGNRDTVIGTRSKCYPFETENSYYHFAYYDPHYECKRAYAEGKQIQCKNIIGNWENDDCPKWHDDVEYRIKPEEPKSRRMTYRELAEWLAKGNGQVKVGNEIHVWFDYSYDTDGCEVVTYKIRRWNSNEWIEPTVDVYFSDCFECVEQECKESEK